MTQKFKIVSLDNTNNHALVSFYDDSVLGTDGTPKVVTLNVLLDGASGAIDNTNVANYISKHFPTNLISPPQNVNMASLASLVGVETTVVAPVSTTPTSTDYISTLINEIMKKDGLA
jgi:hypothetical protein